MTFKLRRQSLKRWPPFSFCWFISFVLCLSCNTKESVTTEISIIWTNNRATSLAIPVSIVSGDPVQVMENAKVCLAGSNSRIAILGTFSAEEEVIFFEPLVPFTRGLRYHLLINDSLLTEIEIPIEKMTDLPDIVSVYPSSDTVPENLLKIYIRFSKSMRAGQALKYISLLNENGDTIKNAFLDIQPELWNKDQTMLTAWLDPGRIKRDLQPNKKWGAPLQASKKYTFTVSNQWRDQNGVTISKPYSRQWVTIFRDDKVPDPEDWELIVPQTATTKPVQVRLTESMDYALLSEVLYITDDNNENVVCSIEVRQEEKIVEFTPYKPWSTGQYSLNIESRLEDLAGNNLNRPFDRDITRENRSQKKLFKRTFSIH
jgi:Bacterial Ig-like domain